ncbi:hypothetical protein H8K35_07900 [Undibacterium sp. LX40W]|uniref:GH18 domain-containing protein n=1 Tax=Undibacterium nitidum TaxID=2762298 RepID=A0A923KPC5_9BURK|nr:MULTISPECIES: glycosyl hydrolase family 18 protein [Undibacterium]MBC3881643.1 hypothetical protein [Undibacterium nitidum]MBC3891574.1 hypothetical protein [Undibacterium sp. LX40W]
MRLFLFALGFSIATLCMVPSSRATNAPSKNAPSIQVIGWVPAYGIDTSLPALESNPDIAKGLTRIGLQFWNPSKDGKSLVFAPVNEQGKLVTEAQVRALVAWAKQRGIQVVLTVYNNSQVMKKWDWELARNAFAQQPKSFSRALLNEMQKFDLDGIDLDLEGEGALDHDRQAYAHFVAQLSKELKKRGKLLTVDSFHSPCTNAPNMSWWVDWRGQVDAIHSMGYQDLYEGSTASFTPEGGNVCENGAAMFKYSWQLQYGVKAGYRADQIVMGMPTWLDHWGEGGAGPSVLNHIQEAKQLSVGVALWDLQLEGKAWRQSETWRAIRDLRAK